MSRGKKLLTAGVVLAIGIALAWPFRKTGPSLDGLPVEDAQSIAAFAMQRQEAGPLVNREPDRSGASRHVTAKMASTSEPALAPTLQSSRSLGGTSFDLANHPAISNTPSSPGMRPQSPIGHLAQEQLTGSASRPDARPAYATAQVVEGEAEKPREIVHIIRGTDTLEKLAARYLGDPGRALEIFDLNNDRLSNPHLLPIGAELRIPVEPGRKLD